MFSILIKSNMSVFDDYCFLWSKKHFPILPCFLINNSWL
jgi:hypothetical protein